MASGLDCQRRRAVSILVFLEPLLRPSGGYNQEGRVCVSILVFLEPLLRHIVGLIVYEPLKDVSILVFLEPLLRPLSELCPDGIFRKFQSLFFWNHCLDNKS